MKELVGRVKEHLVTGTPQFATDNLDYRVDTHAKPMFMSDLVKYIARRQPRIIAKETGNGEGALSEEIRRKRRVHDEKQRRKNE